MTQITSEMLADMHARRLRGETDRQIGARYNVKPNTVYQRLRREHGIEKYEFASVSDRHEKRAAANDNIPGRVIRMSPHNGGCSTLSGMMPVTLVRVPTIDGIDVGLQRGPGPIRIKTGDIVRIAADDVEVAA